MRVFFSKKASCVAERGMTLVELLVALGVTSMALMALVGLQILLFKQSDVLATNVVLDQVIEEAYEGLHVLARDHWGDLQNPGRYHLFFTSPTGWTLMPGPAQIANGKIQATTEITLEPVYREGLLLVPSGTKDDDTIKATIAVTAGRLGSTQIRRRDLTAYVTNWQTGLDLSVLGDVVPGEERAIWRLDEAAGSLHDSSGNNNTLTVFGTPQYGVAGVHATALRFDEKGDYAEISDEDQAGLDGAGPLVIKANVFKREFSGDDYIVEKWTGEQDASYRLYTKNNGSLRFEIKNGIQKAFIASPKDTIPLNTWVEVVAVYDGREMKLFVDSKPVADPVVYLGGVGNSGAALRIGNSDHLTKGFNGIIDELSLWRTLK